MDYAGDHSHRKSGKKIPNPLSTHVGPSVESKQLKQNMYDWILLQRDAEIGFLAIQITVKAPPFERTSKDGRCRKLFRSF